jgi:hypothetical protein
LRKDDPLLSHIHHARNTDEHGIEDITDRSRAGASVKIILNQQKQHFADLEFARGIPENLIVTDLDTGQKYSTIVECRQYVRLLAVRDRRYGDEFQPPTSHFGQDMLIDDPKNVAEHAFAYLCCLVAEADSYVCD